MDEQAKAVDVTLSIPREEYDRLSYIAEADGRTVADILTDRLTKYGQPSEREIAALTILRQKALEQALSLAKPGDTPNSVGWDAERLLETMLGSG